MSNIADLRDRVVILRRQVIEEDEGLGEKLGYVSHATIWAQALKQRITPQAGMDSTELVIVTQGFKIRSGLDVKKGDKLQWKGMMFDIIDSDISDPFYHVLTTKRCEM